MYENTFRENKKYKDVSGKDNWRRAAFNVAEIYGYLYDTEKEQFYNRFRKYKYDHQLKDLDSFLGHKKSLPSTLKK
jgi:hypothetical protein